MVNATLDDEGNLLEGSIIGKQVIIKLLKDL